MMGERAESDPYLLIRIDRFLAGQDSTRTLLELGLVFLRRSSNRVRQLRLILCTAVFDGKSIV